MNTVLREMFSIPQIVASLFIAAIWLAVAIAEDYPAEDWAGIVVIGYLVWRISNEIVFRAAQLGIRKVLAYAHSMYHSKEMNLPSGSSNSWVVHMIAAVYIYSLGLIVSGAMILVTPVIIEAVDLPTLEFTQTFGFISMGAGVLAVIAFFGFALIRLFLMDRSKATRHIARQAIVVSDDKLARSRFPIVASP